MKKLIKMILAIAIVLSISNADKTIAYGKVLELKNVMGYKYLKVNQNGTERWVAIASAPVKVGDRIGYDTQTVMKNFKSKSLNRIFDEIIFANEVYLPPKPKNMIDLLELDKAKEPEITTNDVKGFVVKDFYTVEELFRYRKQLAGKKVSVKAKVRKVSHQIMKRDWVHLEDGTGEETKHTDDIVFTAQNASIKVGDSVVAIGIIVIDKDFGYGYFYPVLGEEATFRRE